MNKDIIEKIKSLKPNSKIRIAFDGIDLELKKRSRAIEIKPKVNYVLWVFLFVITSFITFYLIGFIMISFGELISYETDNFDGTETSFSGVGMIMQWSRDFWFVFLVLTLFLSNIILKKLIFFFYKKKYPNQMEEVLKLTIKNINQDV